MCELLVGQPEVRLLGVIDVICEPLVVIIEQRVPRPSCPGCAGAVVIKERPPAKPVKGHRPDLASWSLLPHDPRPWHR